MTLPQFPSVDGQLSLFQFGAIIKILMHVFQRVNLHFSVGNMPRSGIMSQSMHMLSASSQTVFENSGTDFLSYQ